MRLKRFSAGDLGAGHLVWKLSFQAQSVLS